MSINTLPDLTTLAAAVTGPVLTPDDPDYASETAGFNAAHVVAAAVVVAATDADDVAAAVRWGVDAGLAVRIQSTGHGLVDDLAGSLLISTRRLDLLEIDPVARTARIGAGLRWRAVIDAAAPYGLAPLNGSASGVGVIGYTLGGGMGPMARRYGFAADHVRSLTLVTADGEIRRVDANTHPDLFWAIRGGKIGFGVVTDIEIDLVPVARFVGGGLFYPGASAAEVLDAWREWAPALPDEVSTSVALLRLPPDPHLPPPLQGQFVAHLRFVHLGDAVEAQELLRPMRAAAPILLDSIGEIPYAAVDAVHMGPPMPVPVYDRGLTLGALTADLVQTVVEHAGAKSACVLPVVELRLFGGALSRPAAVPNAVTGRDAAFGMYALGIAAGPFADLGRSQLDGLVGAMTPWRAGGSLNFIGHAAPGETAALWSADDLARLQQIASRYDPTGALGGGVFTA